MLSLYLRESTAEMFRSVQDARSAQSGICNMIDRESRSTEAEGRFMSLAW